MTRTIDDYIREVEEAKEDAQDLADPLEFDSFNWRPASDQWSIGQCIEHLNIFGREYLLPKLDGMIEEIEAKGREGDGRIRMGFIGRRVVSFFDAPAGRKVPTQRSLVPPSDCDRRDVLDRFLELQDDLIARGRRASTLDLCAAKRRLPMPIWLNLGEWLAFAVAHERRHLHQARDVMANQAFPGERGAAALQGI